jgi:hypothetical protein
MDRDTSSYIMKRNSLSVLQRLQGIPVADVFISAVTKCELA